MDAEVLEDLLVLLGTVGSFWLVGSGPAARARQHGSSFTSGGNVESLWCSVRACCSCSKHEATTFADDSVAPLPYSFWPPQTRGGGPHGQGSDDEDVLTRVRARQGCFARD